MKATAALVICIVATTSRALGKDTLKDALDRQTAAIEDIADQERFRNTVGGPAGIPATDYEGRYIELQRLRVEEQRLDLERDRDERERERQTAVRPVFVPSPILAPALHGQYRARDWVESGISAESGQTLYWDRLSVVVVGKARIFAEKIGPDGVEIEVVVDCATKIVGYPNGGPPPIFIRRDAVLANALIGACSMRAPGSATKRLDSPVTVSARATTTRRAGNALPKPIPTAYPNVSPSPPSLTHTSPNRRGAGETCAGPADCIGNLLCADSRCVTPRLEGSSCRISEECSGALCCLGGTCSAKCYPNLPNP